MEIGSIASTMQTQAKPIESTAQQATKQNQQQEQKNILEKVKNEPGYVPTLQEAVVIKAIEDANKKLNGGPREFEFTIHEQTKQIMVKVVDSSTKEVVREVPPEKILDMVASMCEAAGIFVDEKR